jgi:hypothetical protein
MTADNRRVVRLADLRPEVRAVVMALLAQSKKEPVAIEQPTGSSVEVCHEHPDCAA